MLKNYYTTALEDWVTNFYTRLRILHPRQIKIENIAKVNEIFIHKKPMPSYYEVMGRYRGITIDSRVSFTVQREMFFHELCHIMRHTGRQSMMLAALRELQERDARHFTRYAAIPHHMLKFVDFEDPYVIDQMASLFKVTPKLCEERLEQIHNRCFKYIAESRHKYEV
ncbi:ImmA/IrrE family metallo-endopeptidase [Bacillus sp. ISL-7]|uniref:ImmA/IrrE family metallo-endopeptidase n=1 Tax=Bacillus sp. ISL-7 TaxID=2819136 RepID=UPI001BEBC19F|nr:ImmA/IrrE family metallo-endopeptidase [Bacillus sp. ISL-7]MBT2735184.1 ImmA/IrrE family metallo-endopeptidase [Bacillus sp. ISL-7]